MAKRTERVYLSESVAQAEEKDIKVLERMLEADRRSGRDKISDEATFVNEIKQRKADLARHTPRKLTGRKQNAAYKRAKELKAEIQEVFQSEKKFNLPYPKSGASHKVERSFEDAVNHEMKLLQDPQLQNKMQEYKSRMAEIDPQDREIRNLESLRK